MKNHRFLLGGIVFWIGICCVAGVWAAANAETDVSQKDQPNVMHPFNGENLDGWKFDDIARANDWRVGRAKLDPDDAAQLIVGEGGGHLINPAGKTRNIYTKRKFGDARIELEVMLPYRSNSGVYVMGRYELQILHDPPGGEADHMDHGAIARVAAPEPFVSIEPGEWQKITIDYRAPRFNEQGEKIANAEFVKVAINGKTIHENVEVERAGYGALTMEEAPTGPLYLQGNEGPVAYRNIKVIPKH